MHTAPATHHYDIVISGAGPAGCACALALKGSGLRVVLIDKASFPRDKVCGDAIPGLRKIDPAYEQAFAAFPQKLATKHTTLFYKGREVTFDWVREAYTCTRMAFDDLLFSLVKEHTDTTIYTSTTPGTAIRHANGFTILIKDSDMVFDTRLLVGADGAQSPLAKQLVSRTVDRDHYVGSVRAYYTNVAYAAGDTTEIYFDKRYLPSYLWVFPIAGNRANVGFGMLSSEIAKRKMNIKQAFYEFIEQVPVLRDKFKDATQVGELEGFGLPLGSNVGTISGDNFMLTGDAASLIDPISGDGIGNAMLSGRLAALQAIQCFLQNNFTSGFMNGYDKALLAAIGPELRTHYNAQRILSRAPFLLDTIMAACGNSTLKRWIQRKL